MSNFFEYLKKYFTETPREKVQQEWAKSVEFDSIGPTVEEFLTNSQRYHIYSHDPGYGCMQDINHHFNPKFDSGFFLNRN